LALDKGIATISRLTQWRRSVNPSFFLPSRGLPTGSRRARSPAAKHFDAIYAVKLPSKIQSDV